MKNNPNELAWVAADWPVPSHIHAGSTLRSGGVSKPPYDQLNLGLHVNDEQGCVLTNRERLAKELKLPAEPVWLNQEHGNNIIRLDSQEDSETTTNTADGSYATETNQVCVVMTADCLPLLLCDDEGTQVAAVHVGWRGLSKNIISVALEKFTCPNEKILAWLSFQPFYGRPAYRHTAEISIYIDPAHQGRGLGRQLLDEAIARVPELGLRMLLGFIFAHNEASVRLFRSRGFEEWGQFPNIAEMDDREYTLVIYGRRVGVRAF